MALISWDRRILARVAHHQLTAAAAAAQQTREQRWSLLRCSGTLIRLKAGAIVVKHLLNPRELLPGDVAVVMLGNQYGPLVHWLARNRLLEGSVDHLSLSRRSPVGVGAGVGRLLQHADYIPIGRSSPPRLPARQSLPLRREIDAVVDEPHRHLTRAGQLEELCEDQLDCMLHAQVGILLQSLVGGLDEAHRRLDHQLTAPRLRPASLERALTQEIELVLAHTALEAQQQPIVGPAQIVDSLVIDEQCVDHPAHLEQLVPVAVVARESGDLDRRDRSDLSQAHLGHQPLKAGPADCRRGRTSLILVDDFRLIPAQIARLGRSLSFGCRSEGSTTGADRLALRTAGLDALDS